MTQPGTTMELRLTMYGTCCNCGHTRELTAISYEDEIVKPSYGDEMESKYTCGECYGLTTTVRARPSESK
jgi:hypothetical protein